MPVAVTVRRATAKDADAVLACLHEAFAPYRELYSRQGFSDTTLTAKTLRRRMAEMTVLVAVLPDGELVGTVAWGISRDEGHIRGMAVRPQWQGSGVAPQLLAAVEAESRARGCRRITLDTTAPLQRAAAFYVRQGFRASGKVADFFGMPLYEYVKELE